MYQKALQFDESDEKIAHLEKELKQIEIDKENEYQKKLNAKVQEWIKQKASI